MAKRIYISPSNQDGNSYAVGNTNEMAQCDKIAAAAAKALKRCGFEVKVGKSGDTMANRCKESDNFNADIHMPIHTNAYNGKVTGGTRIFCLNSNFKKPCDCILKYLGAISPGTSDSVQYQTGLYEINVPTAVTVYVECEFHDTSIGAKWIINNTNKIAEAICHGLCDYFGVSYKAEGGSSGSGNVPADGYKPEQPYIVRITADDGVNIRRGAGTNFSKVGAIGKGGAYTITYIRPGQGAKLWGRLKSGAGWIALDYTERID